MILTKWFHLGYHRMLFVSHTRRRRRNIGKVNLKHPYIRKQSTLQYFCFCQLFSRQKNYFSKFVWTSSLNGQPIHWFIDIPMSGHYIKYKITFLGITIVLRRRLSFLAVLSHHRQKVVFENELGFLSAGFFAKECLFWKWRFSDFRQSSFSFIGALQESSWGRIKVQNL